MLLIFLKFSHSWRSVVCGWRPLLPVICYSGVCLPNVLRAFRFWPFSDHAAPLPQPNSPTPVFMLWAPDIQISAFIQQVILYLVVDCFSFSFLGRPWCFLPTPIDPTFFTTLPVFEEETKINLEVNIYCHITLPQNCLNGHRDRFTILCNDLHEDV